MRTNKLIPYLATLQFTFLPLLSPAYKASSYLQEFLRLGAIVPKPSQELDKIYLEFAPLSPQLLTLTSCPPPPQNPSSTTTSDPNYPSELQQAPNVDDVTTTTKTNSEDLESTSSRTSSPSSPSSTAPSSPLSPPSSSEASTNQQRQQQQEEHQHDRSSDQQRRLILTREAVPAIMKLFDLRANSSFAGDVYRALEQARLRMAKDP